MITVIHGDNPRWFNHFSDPNPAAFFGFSSLGAFVDFVAALDPDKAGAKAGWRIHDTDFHGTRNMSEALDLARNGWFDHIELPKNFNIPFAQRKQRVYSIVGGSVNVGRMLSGNPVHMRTRKTAPSHKSITLFVQAGFVASVSSDAAIIRALLIGEIVDILETQGYSCEIVAVMTSRDDTGNRQGCQTAITIKQAGERLNLSDICFALGHPSMLRRLSFACVGSFSECKSSWRNMGRTTNAFNDNHRVGSNEYYIRALTSRDGYTADALLSAVIPEGLPIKL